MKTTIKMLFVTAILMQGVPAANAQDVTHMNVGGYTSQPIGHYEYCRKYRADCTIISINASVPKLTRSRWDELVEVNAKINRTVVPVTDNTYYKREEVWEYPLQYGDCEDFVLAKRKVLMDRGWPASSVLITVVRQPNGDGHAVLVVRTDRADYVLDNMVDKIMAWNETDYTFLKRQAANNSGMWRSVVDDHMMVGSIR